MKHSFAFVVAAGSAVVIVACLSNCSTRTPGAAAPMMGAEMTEAPEVAAEVPSLADARTALQRPCLDYWPDGAPRNMGRNFWAKRRLKVEFLGGSEALRKRVEDDAKIWTQHAHVTFEFGQFEDSDIRISFDRRLGHFSAVGTDAEGISEGKRTMNLALTDNDSNGTVRAIVLHEFGHALGLMHEHQHPENPIVWNEEAVFQYYADPPNEWSREQTRKNVIQRYSRSQSATEFEFTSFDRNSIMLYPVTPGLTKNRYQVGWNKTLSANDKAFIASKYP